MYNAIKEIKVERKERETLHKTYDNKLIAESHIWLWTISKLFNQLNVFMLAGLVVGICSCEIR